MDKTGYGRVGYGAGTGHREYRSKIGKAPLFDAVGKRQHRVGIALGTAEGSDLAAVDRRSVHRGIDGEGIADVEFTRIGDGAVDAVNADQRLAGYISRLNRRGGGLNRRFCRLDGRRVISDVIMRQIVRLIQGCPARAVDDIGGDVNGLSAVAVEHDTGDVCRYGRGVDLMPGFIHAARRHRRTGPYGTVLPIIHIGGAPADSVGEIHGEVARGGGGGLDGSRGRLNGRRHIPHGIIVIIHLALGIPQGAVNDTARDIDGLSAVAVEHDSGDVSRNRRRIDLLTILVDICLRHRTAGPCGTVFPVVHVHGAPVQRVGEQDSDGVSAGIRYGLFSRESRHRRHHHHHQSKDQYK